MVSILSFSVFLGTHVRDHHSDTAIWSCSHCPHQYPSHNHLHQHMYLFHLEGQFVCGIDGCMFDKVSTTRSVIYCHLLTAHPSTIYTCDIDGCSKTFKQIGHFQAHQRMHLGIKPYHCKWTGCGYASTHQSHVLTHIRTQHLKLPPTLKQQQAEGIVDNREPRDYLHVDTKLLRQSQARSK